LKHDVSHAAEVRSLSGVCKEKGVDGNFASTPFLIFSVRKNYLPFLGGFLVSFFGFFFMGNSFSD
jgi:hypothetical protein